MGVVLVLVMVVGWLCGRCGTGGGVMDVTVEYDASPTLGFLTSLPEY